MTIDAWVRASMRCLLASAQSATPLHSAKLNLQILGVSIHSLVRSLCFPLFLSLHLANPECLPQASVEGAGNLHSPTSRDRTSTIITPAPQLPASF
ncbi:hypothetical protein CC80DRAFT_43223 [Byssothecium circinans]|uniref:Uncharacterized protein n=1 Tax=Byssothecium circinans TaxID=147558 RepID=A0A6A5U318_9PLEO|nr:hypothetical protein CC80DRAFT_43223 [Byssothecium circinans]